MFERRYFIVAPNFHGATLLAKLLNAHPDVVSLGDTYPSNRFDQVCGCRNHVSECDFWQSIGCRVDAERYRTFPHLLPDYPRITGDRIDRWLYNTLPPSRLKQLIPAQRLDAFVTDFRNFLEAVFDLQACDSPAVFVDGVKSVSRIKALLAAGEQVDGIIHLVRDPGNFVKSSMRQQAQTLQVLAKNALVWRLFHNRARTLKKQVPYLCLSYEAMAAQTDDSLAKIFRFLFVPEMGVEDLRRFFDQEWHFMGNASLFQFDGRIHSRHHELSSAERRWIRLLAGNDGGV